LKKNNNNRDAWKLILN